MQALRSLTLYCSSSRSLDPHFAVAARTAGELCARRGITLVYGGGGLGLMGEAARACKAAGGRVEGIITRKFLDLEQGWDGCDELVVVETMRERKRLLVERAGGFLVLPGASGIVLGRSSGGVMATSVVVALVGAAVGFHLSYEWDAPTGPACVAVALVLFVACAAIAAVRGRYSG